jgi:hypothetical protein
MNFRERHPQLPRLWRLEQLECVNGAATGSIRVAGGPLNVGRPAGTVSLAPLGCKFALILADAPTPIRYPASLVGGLDAIRSN